VSVTPASQQGISPSGCYETTGATSGLWFNPTAGSEDFSFGDLTLCVVRGGQPHGFDPRAAHCSKICQRVQDQGYPCECHDIVTSDGFVLQTVRMPRKPGVGSDRPPVVWLQHGFEGSCTDWISQSKTSDALGYTLYNEGFDVWMGNSRGNVFSFGNQKLDISSTAFWDAVDFDTMASIDTPAVIDYVLSTTRQQKLSWVGHSQGTTQMFIALSQKYTLKDGRHIADALDAVGMLAPVAYVYHSDSLILKLLADFHIGEIYVFLGDRDFLGPKITWLLHAISGLCKIPAQCPTVLWPIMGGGNFSNVASGTYINATRYDPADTSVHNMEHFAQHLRVNRFGAYDYGKDGNLKKYHSATPPDYKLSDVSGVRMAVFNGVHDDLADMKDVSRLLLELPSETVAYHKELEYYGHMDFIWGQDARTEVYDPLITFLKQKISKKSNQENENTRAVFL
jgi:pimeloyl-ACP methyl ester carboxylesterase